MYIISKGSGTINAARFTVILGYEGDTEKVKNIIVNSGLEIIKWIVHRYCSKPQNIRES